MKRGKNKGFTLAELLIVVAIIAVLVAVAIPVFTSQLERSRRAATAANIRAAYAEATADMIENGTTTKDISGVICETKVDPAEEEFKNLPVSAGSLTGINQKGTATIRFTASGNKVDASVVTFSNR